MDTKPTVRPDLGTRKPNERMKQETLEMYDKIERELDRRSEQSTPEQQQLKDGNEITRSTARKRGYSLHPRLAEKMNEQETPLKCPKCGLYRCSC